MSVKKPWCSAALTKSEVIVSMRGSQSCSEMVGMARLMYVDTAVVSE